MKTLSPQRLHYEIIHGSVPSSSSMLAWFRVRLLTCASSARHDSWGVAEGLQIWIELRGGVRYSGALWFTA